MARIVFSGLEPRTAEQLAQLLAIDGHEIRRESRNAPIRQILSANLVFVGGEPMYYLPLLRRVRAVDQNLCLVVIARFSATTEWLNALEAGATDYWVTPFHLPQIRSLIADAVTYPDNGVLANHEASILASQGISALANSM
jgi:DNA-binding response OmpR family regulator